MAGIFTVQNTEKICVCLQGEWSDYQCQWSVSWERGVCDGRAGVERQWEHSFACGSAESRVASVSWAADSQAEPHQEQKERR